MSKNKKPEWVPENANEQYTTNVMDGVQGGHDGLGQTVSTVRHNRVIKRRQTLSIDDYYNGVIENNLPVVAQAITLIESNAKKHFDISQELVQRLLPHSGNSIRIGISGVPGAGKSTLIEAFGLMLCEQGHKVAVLAVDPSSSITGGSILGDKTRMEKLSRHQNAFIRPSPSAGMLGGVARKSRETMLLCEAAGYDVILVETVGVGQNEVTVRSMVDFFLLVLITGAGDELQGMKKGVMEICDCIAVNKADGDNIIRAKSAMTEFNNLLHYLRPATEGWASRAITCSALYQDGIEELWHLIETFRQTTEASGVYATRRQQQTLEWVFGMVIEQLKSRFYSHDGVKRAIPQLKTDLISGEITATKAVTQLMAIFDEVKL
ncbi:methylmalonyl Co-A mutase-associated GTPase MeaB [Fusibacter paucivorans]|uniref:Methylmalonyl Co-A mutase-associated GTPase MeaB n=1 Tax=Fusibacter paucivorans TaxID=76009 RepID=A0ABS5PUR5_9FIRM|nr:methylmalonyl Co-A mutase-associated GTPase MeaB [Fusibacter paucivorans]MBS7528316.1 methylmalonyl Co-A mutase-associated GTPase MeaB [Fusibacter paucivorans]